MLRHLGDTLQLVGRLRESIDVSMYTPEFFHARLSELDELGVSDEAIARSSVALLDHLQQSRICQKCSGYASCPKVGDAKGTITRLDAEDGELFIRTRPCDPFLKWCGERKLERWKAYAGELPQGDFTFASFPEEQRLKSPQLVAAVQNFASTYEAGESARGFYIYGPPGVGKTHLAVAAVRELERRKIPTLFIRAEVLFDRLRGSIAANREIEPIIEAYCEVPALVIDEFGQERANEFTMEKIFRIVNARFAAHRPTLFTSNYEPPIIYGRVETELRQLVDSLRSRLLSMCRCGHLHGSDFRMRQMDLLDA